jgi:hypothetical protein
MSGMGIRMASDSVQTILGLRLLLQIGGLLMSLTPRAAM